MIKTNKYNREIYVKPRVIISVLLQFSEAVYMRDILNSNLFQISIHLKIRLVYLTKVSTGGPKYRKSILLRMLKRNILFFEFCL